VIEAAETALARIKDGRHARGLVLGLRGVGKTVLLNRLEELAEAAGFLTVTLEAPEDKKLAEMLVPALRTALFKLSRVDSARELAKRGLAVLRAFAGAFKVSICRSCTPISSRSGARRPKMPRRSHPSPDAQAATALAVKRLDEGFFRVRFDRLTPREKDYMRAMAKLGPGPHRSVMSHGRWASR
jgi:hypothetical protein